MKLLPLIAPATAYVVVFLAVRRTRQDQDPRLAFIHACLLLGAWHIATLEVLSLGKWITREGLLLAWGVLAALGLGWLYRHPAKHSVTFGLSSLLSLRPSEIILLSLVAAIAAATGLVGWFSPPQTWDALTYHVSRVAHWAQNGTLAHYPSGILRQISMPPGGEIGMLSLMVLTGGDGFLSLHQWFMMLGSVIAVSYLAKQVGANRSGQLVAALFVAALPIGIVEASSTINDYVGTFWTVCAFAEALEYARTGQARLLALCAVGAGLAILTKPTVVPYLFVLAVGLGVLSLARSGTARSLRWGIVAASIVVAINAGHLSRNLVTFGALSNPVDFDTHRSELITPAGVLSGVLKQAALQAGLPEPFAAYNQALDGLIRKVHGKLGVKVMDPRTTGDGVFMIRAPSRSEDLTSNPYHAYLSVAVVGIALVAHRRVGGLAITLALVVVLGFVAFSGIFKWHVFSVRYHLVFFVLMGPVVGRVLSGRPFVDRIGFALAGLLAVASLPWLVAIDSRPLVTSWLPTRAPSVLAASRETLAFGDGDLQRLHSRFVGLITEAHCQDVGLMIGGDDGEYLWWATLGAPGSGVRIEWIVSGPTERYEDPDFAPCAVVCHHCPDEWTSVRGLEVRLEDMDWVLFLGQRGPSGPQGSAQLRLTGRALRVVPSGSPPQPTWYADAP